MAYKYLNDDGLKALVKKIKAYIASLLPTLSITYAELKALRDAGKLLAGRKYRITDYVTTTTQTDTRSAGHAFDIIVVADDEHTLNENARAILHNGDTYFAGCKLGAWELKYCLDNDTTRFAWTDATNGKGVVWWMKDEWDNECYYDFKNIQYKRYKVTSTNASTADLVTSCPYLGNAVQNSTGLSESVDTDFKWVYTFTKYTQTGDLIEDASILAEQPQSDYGIMCGCYGNKIGALYESVTKDDGGFFKTLYLNGGMFWTNGFNPDYGNDRNVICFLNEIGGDCSNFTALQSVNQIKCGNYCNYWTCGNNCASWTCGNDCSSWTCGNNCYSWTCGNNCSFWTCGNHSYYWTCGNNCNFWTCGNYCPFWTCGNNCDSWTCGNYCDSWTCGNYCNSWTCGNNCNSWTCGNEVQSTQILQDFVSYFHLDSSVSYVTIKSSGTPTRSTPLQNFKVKAGIKGAFNNKLAIVIDATSFPLGSDYEWTIAKNSSGAVKQYCEADLIN